MDILPLQVYQMAMDHVPVRDLSRIVRCSKSHGERVKPMLYRVLYLTFDNGNLQPQTQLLIRTLLHNPDLGGLVRAVHLESNRPGVWTTGISQLLGTLLLPMGVFPVDITSFSTAFSWVPLNNFFPSLTSLTNEGPASPVQQRWLRWHLLNCKSISRLHLCHTRVGNNFQSSLMEAMEPKGLTELYLENCAVESLIPQRSWRLKLLDLRCCSGTDSFIKRLISSEQLRSVGVLRLSGRLSRQTLVSLFDSLNENSQLEEFYLQLDSLLDLATQGHLCRSFAPSKLKAFYQNLRSRIIDYLRVHGLTLRCAVIDIRQDINLCSPSLSFSLQDISDLAEQCPCLTFLGLPIDFLDLSRNKAGHLQNSITLQALHIRGDFGALSDLAMNMKILANLAGAQKKLQIFIGHGNLLKHVLSPTSGSPFFKSVDKLQRSLYCLDF